MTELALAAFVLGLTGGLKPGPLSVYIIHVTLTRGNRAGLLACFAPFVSDGPIILLSILVLSQGRQFDYFISALSFAGAAYLVYLALKILFTSNKPDLSSSDMPASFMTAVKLNLVNPYPYLFWGTVGGVYLIRGSAIEAAVFIFVMLGTLAITKFIVAQSIKALGDRFDANAYLLLLRILAVVLIGFAIKLAIDGYLLLQKNLYC